MNRITRYALALALGLSVGSAAAFADAPQTQTPNTQLAMPQYVPQMPGTNSFTPGPYDGYNFAPGA